MFRHLGKLNLGIRPEDFFRRYDYKDLINLSIPAALERLVMRIGQVLYYGLIVSIGINTYAAHTIAGNIESFFYMPAFGLSTAASILLGNCVGRRDMKNAVEYSRYLMKITMVFALMGGFILFFGGESFASIFTRDKEAVDKIIIALGIDAFAQIPLGISIVYTGALQGMGDTKSPLYSTVIGMWGLRVIGVYILGVYLKMDIAGI